MAVSDGEHILMLYKDLGMVSQVLDERRLPTLRGDLAIAHCRYSTTGSTVWENAQPTLRLGPRRALAIGHNGNLVNTRQLLDQLHGGRARLPASTDTELLTALLADEPAADTVDRRSCASCPRVRGRVLASWSSTSAGSSACATRSASGRSCSGASRTRRVGRGSGRTTTGPLAGASRRRRPRSTSSAPSTFGTWSRARSSSSSRAASPCPCATPSRRRRCASSSSSTSPARTRTWRAATCTRSVARWACSSRVEHPADADLVMPVPDTGAPAAAGFAEASGLPYREGMYRNRYAGRTFIQPSQTMRQRGVTIKLNPLREVGPRQAPDRRRRLDRPRHHDAPDRPGAPRGRRDRGPRPDQRAADLPPVLLRHRHVDRDRADRLDPHRRRRSRSSSGRTRSATCRSRASWRRSSCRTSGSASPASTATTRCPSPYDAREPQVRARGHPGWR